MPTTLPVQFRLIRVKAGNNSRDVSPVSTAVGNKGKSISVFINVDRKVQEHAASKRGVFLGAAVIGQQLFVGEVAVFIGVDDRLPDVAVVKNEAIVQRAGIVVIFCGFSKLFESRF